MNSTRRGILAVLASGGIAGCLNGGGSDGTTPSPTTTVETPTPTRAPDAPSPTPLSCDPSDVNRPPVVEDANLSGKGYGTKPQELNAQSVADYLADFETAYAWNRILVDHGPVSRLNIDTTTPWTPERDGAGFLASSRIETSYTPEDGDEPVEAAYVASYYVASGPVYRAQTDADAVDPRSHPDRVLVQCGSDAKG
ncbi:MAG: hypothetical protein ABEH64_02055 [Salinirussus sp.]